MKKITFLLLSAVILLACKKEPITWESDWTLPLINDTLSLENWVNDSTLGVNGGGFYELNLNRVLFDLKLNELIEIPDTTIEENFTFALNSFIASPGFTFVSSTEEHNLNLDDVELKVITLKKGFIDVTVLNPVATTAIFKVKLPGVTKDGVVYEEIYTAPPGTNANPGKVTKTIDLSGYTLVLTGASGAGSNRLLSQIQVSTSPSGPTVTITNQDITKVKATFRDVQISYAKGYFGNKIIEDKDTLDLKLFGGYQSGFLDIGNTSLRFTIENGIKVSAHAKLKGLKTFNALGAEVALNHPQVNSTLVVNPASGYWSSLLPTYTVIEANSGNSNIEEYIENLGNKHEVDYRVELNPWGNVTGSTDEIFPNSKFKIRLEADMPLLIGMDDLVLQDTFPLNIDQEESDLEILGGDLIVKASNSFPLGAELLLFLVDENGSILHEVLSSGTVKSGVYGMPEGSHNLKTSHTELIFTLTEAMVADLDMVTHVIVKAKLKTPNAITGLNEQVQIPEHAFLAIRMKSAFKTSNKL